MEHWVLRISDLLIPMKDWAHLAQDIGAIMHYYDLIKAKVRCFDEPFVKQGIGKDSARFLWKGLNFIMTKSWTYRFSVSRWWMECHTRPPDKFLSCLFEHTLKILITVWFQLQKASVAGSDGLSLVLPTYGSGSMFFLMMILVNQSLNCCHPRFLASGHHCFYFEGRHLSGLHEPFSSGDPLG